jgi:cytochrome c peroxidase
MKIILLFIITSYLFSKKIISPIPLQNVYDNKKAKLGKKLFFDVRA